MAGEAEASIRLLWGRGESPVEEGSTMMHNGSRGDPLVWFERAGAVIDSSGSLVRVTHGAEASVDCSGMTGCGCLIILTDAQMC